MPKPKCWLAQFSKAECEGRMDRCHLIPKQRLRIKNIEDVWDRAVWVWGCRRHHTLFDHKFLHLKREDLPEAVELWAQANRLEWSLTRDYGPLPEDEELWNKNDDRLGEPCKKCGAFTVLDGVIQKTRLVTKDGWLCGECAE